MNDPSVAGVSTLFHWLRAAVLGLAATALAGCTSWSAHDLEAVATSQLNTKDRQTLNVELAGVQADDRTPAGLETAAAILAAANPEASSSPAARARQAVVVGRLFSSNVTEPSAAWLTPETAPELIACLHEVFNQADARLRSPTPDLMTAMVWGQTGTALGRSDEIHAMLELAKTDARLKKLIREDDPTRERLYNFAVAPRKSDWWREVSGVVFRPRVPSPTEQFNGAMTDIIMLPAYAVMIVVWALHGAPVL